MKTIKLANENEKFVLALWACNQTIKESAKYLNISERTVDYYRSRLKCRLGATSSNEVINQLILMDEYETLIRLGREVIFRSPKAITFEKKRLLFEASGKSLSHYQ